jgi:hypothetical protein
MNESSDNQSPDPFSRKWLLLVILCVVPLFFLFAVLGDPGRGRASGICAGVCMTAIRACWNLRKRVSFWMIAAILIALHVFLIAFLSWMDKSYPGYALLPFAVLEYGIMYKAFKLVGKVANRGERTGESRPGGEE